MDYREAIAYVIERSGYDRGFVANPFDSETVGLRRTEWLANALGRPDQRYPLVHVAGTKGKGSTAAFASAILQASGRKVGLYTSPHLHTFRERFQIDGEPIGREAFAQLVDELAPLNARLGQERPEWGEATAFELTTVLAFLAFARAEVDLAVIEVGLGGRLDSTNIIDPTVSVITPISFDHMAILGTTLAQIAAEKAGIIKPGRPVVVGVQPDEARVTIERIAGERGGPLVLAGRDWQTSGTSESFDLSGPWGTYERLSLGLVGQHQVENAATAVAACWQLEQAGITVDEVAVRAGLAGVTWPGRLEVVQERPKVVVDGAHNVDSIRRLLAALSDHFDWHNLIFVLGIARDKDIAGMLELLAPRADRILVTASESPRASKPRAIAIAAAQFGAAGLSVTESPSVTEALSQALAEATPSDLICVTGSLYVVAEAREAFGLGQADEFERELLYR
ncbi:MAG TPA: folylpolyglutamate synthase/dihydrofolate synthase family protein [Thermomicrobiaceae bacterium]|nr:folylpolyglutamate synthase/dihydrofolate synthase family protein [Thermomicrobiaceae bacterium]